MSHERKLTEHLLENIRHLDLSGMRLSHQEICLLATALQSNLSVQILDLRDNWLEGESISVLARSLMINQTLEELRLEGRLSVGKVARAAIGELQKSRPELAISGLHGRNGTPTRRRPSDQPAFFPERSLTTDDAGRQR